MLRWMMICSFLICSLICFRSSPTRPQDVRRELMGAIEHDSRLYRACMDNLKNQFTPGYKSTDVFAALDFQPNSRLRLRMNQGQLRETLSPWDVAIDGEGFFLLSDGTLTRNGQFQASANGLRLGELALMGADGKRLSWMPDGCSPDIGPDGRFRMTRLNGDGKPEDCGQIVLARVDQPEWLERVGNNFRVTAESGPIRSLETPGRNGTGVLAQGYLELANLNRLEQQKTAESLRAYAGLLGTEVEGLP